MSKKDSEDPVMAKLEEILQRLNSIEQRLGLTPVKHGVPGSVRALRDNWETAAALRAAARAQGETKPRPKSTMGQAPVQVPEKKKHSRSNSKSSGGKKKSSKEDKAEKAKAEKAAKAKEEEEKKKAEELLKQQGPSVEYWDVNVLTPNGRRLTCMISSGEGQPPALIQLKEEIEEQVQVHPVMQRLLMSEDAQPDNMSGLHHGSTIELGQMRTHRKVECIIQVVIASGETINLKIDREDSVCDLRFLLRDKARIAPNVGLVEFSGQTWPLETVLDRIGVTNGSTLYLR